MRLAIGLWLVVMAGGFAWLLNEQNRAGAPASPPAVWPEASRIAHGKGRFTLLVFAHPKCGCTVATLRDLERLLAHAPRDLDVDVVFALPAGAPPDWSRTSLTRTAREIEGVTVVLDPGQVDERRFGARTSGQALIYAGDGRLRFAGGLTPGRAHEGDNAGCDAILSQLTSTSRPAATTPVFGCALADRPGPGRTR